MLSVHVWEQGKVWCAVGLLGLWIAAGCDGNTTTTRPEAGAGDAGDVGEAGQSSDAGSGGKSPGEGGGSQTEGGATEPGAAGAPTTAPGDLDDFLEGEAAGFCERLFRCNQASDDLTEARLLLKTVEGCKAELALSNTQQASMADLRAQIAAGNSHLVPSEAEKCLAALADCNGPDSLGEGECRNVFQGNALEGEACNRRADCAGDAYCKSSGTCPGMCTPRLGANAVCSEGDACSEAKGLAYCDGESGDAVCRPLSVAKPAKLSEPCTKRLGGVSEVVFCEDGLWCGIADGGTDADQLGQCRAVIPTDGDCLDFDDVCEAGFCNTDTGKCGTVTLRDKVGQTCDKATYTVCDPILNLHCSDQGLCEEGGDGSQDALCFTGDWQRRCDPGLYCLRPENATSGSCQPQLEDGKPCQGGPECLSGECNITCQPRYCEYY